MWLIPSIRSAFFGEQNEHADLVTEVVKREPFRVVVTERGTVNSKRNATLSCQVEGGSTIISIVPEGAQVQEPTVSTIAGTVTRIVSSGEDQRYITVRGEPPVVVHPRFAFYVPGVEVEHTVRKGEFTRVLVSLGETVDKGDYLAGDVCCELDASVFEDNLREQQIAITKAEGEVKKEWSNVETQINQNESDIAKAQLDRDLARLDLEKYLKGEALQERLALQGEVNVAEQELAQRLEEYQFVKDNVKLGFKTLQELEAARIAVIKAQTQLDNAQAKLNLQEYTYRRTLKEREALAEETVREIDRVKLKAQQALDFFRASYEAARETYDFELNKLARLKKQLENCLLVAPQAGKVVYANQESRRSEPAVIEEGVQVHERQKIINLPDFSQMKVEVKIHESKISPLEVDQPARIRIDAVPGRIFNGRVSTIPDVPVRGSWPNYDLMFYEIDVLITDQDTSILKPGMNAEVEIIVEQRKDVLQAPVQSLVNVGDEYVAYVLTSEGPKLRRGIQIGQSNNKAIEILDGLEEGDLVVMNPGTQFEPELDELRKELEAEQADHQSKEKEFVGKSEPELQPEPDAGERPDRPSAKKKKARTKAASQPQRVNTAGGG